MRTKELTQVGAGHPAVRHYLDITRRRPRTPRRAVAIEGVWSLTRALDAGVTVESVFVCPELERGDDTHQALQKAWAEGATVLRVAPRLLHRMVQRDGPDGVAAVVHLHDHRLADVPLARPSRVVVVDRAELPGNVGAIIRCADAAGARAVVLTDSRTRITHPLAVKASMGTVFSTPVIETSAEAAIGWARRSRLRIVAADPAATVPYRDVDLRVPVALVVGSERFGLAAAWRQAADVLVSIPMAGRGDSLNVGHAAALLLYEALHQQQPG